MGRVMVGGRSGGGVRDWGGGGSGGGGGGGVVVGGLSSNCWGIPWSSWSSWLVVGTGGGER